MRTIPLLIVAVLSIQVSNAAFASSRRFGLVLALAAAPGPVSWVRTGSWASLWSSPGQAGDDEALPMVPDATDQPLNRSWSAILSADPSLAAEAAGVVARRYGAAWVVLAVADGPVPSADLASGLPAAGSTVPAYHLFVVRNGVVIGSRDYEPGPGREWRLHRDLALVWVADVLASAFPADDHDAGSGVPSMSSPDATDIDRTLEPPAGTVVLPPD